MTESEFRTWVTPKLRTCPFIPILIEGTKGRRVTIDSPEQLDLQPDHAVLTYPRAGRQVRVPYSDVTALRLYDELPAEPGALSYRDFYAILRPLYWAEPFRPFALEFVDGDRLVIEDSHLLLLSGRSGSYHGRTRPAPLRFAVNRVAGVSLVPEQEVARA